MLVSVLLSRSLFLSSFCKRCKTLLMGLFEKLNYTESPGLVFGRLSFLPGSWTLYGSLCDPAWGSPSSNACPARLIEDTVQLVA